MCGQYSRVERHVLCHSPWSRDAARLVLQAAEYDRIRRSAPQPLPIADWVGLQLYDSAQQVSSA